MILTMRVTKHRLLQLYRTHGLLSFLLAFSPLLPRVVEFHTSVYLHFVQALTGTAEGLENTIRVIFGQRGVTAYRDFLEHHPQIILPSTIFSTFLTRHDWRYGLKLTSKMFFDRRQRQFPDSDKFRASLILEIPTILQAYPLPEHTPFRSRLLALTANQAAIDQGLTSQLAFIDTAARLLIQQQTKKHLLHEQRMEALFKAIEARIKAELAGSTAAFTAPVTELTFEDMPAILLTDTDEENLLTGIRTLAASPSKEIASRAEEALTEFQAMTKPKKLATEDGFQPIPN